MVDLEHLLFLYLAHNSFTGSDILTFLPKVTSDLDISHNLFTGSISFTTTGYALQDFYVRSNFFTGSLLAHVVNLDLGVNFFTGSVPSQINSVSGFLVFVLHCTALS